MASTTVNPTRMELTRQKRRLATAMRGYRLLKDKRDELMRRFLELVRENRSLRERVEDGIREAGRSFVLAGLTTSEEALGCALLAPRRSLEVEVSTRNVMSVEIPVFSYSAAAAGEGGLASYGYAYTSADLDDAIGSLEGLFQDMLRLAEVEKACQLMADEIEKTRRRVNALEHVMIPSAQEKIRYISMKLDENERASQVRLMKVKEMVLEQARAERLREDGAA